MNGKGTLYYSSGMTAYEGDWINDKFDGQGILNNEKPHMVNLRFDGKDFDLVEEYGEGNEYMV